MSFELVDLALTCRDLRGLRGPNGDPRAVMIALCSFANNVSHQWNPDIAELAERADVSRASVFRALAWLESNGFVSSQPQGRRTLYTVHIQRLEASQPLNGSHAETGLTLRRVSGGDGQGSHAETGMGLTLRPNTKEGSVQESVKNQDSESKRTASQSVAAARDSSQANGKGNGHERSARQRLRWQNTKRGRELAPIKRAAEAAGFDSRPHKFETGAEYLARFKAWQDSAPDDPAMRARFAELAEKLRAKFEEVET